MRARSRRRPSKAPPPRLDLEEIEHDPGFRGMLSFLQSPLEGAPIPRDWNLPQPPVLNQAESHAQDLAQQPVGLSPTGNSPEGLPPSGFTPRDDVALYRPTRFRPTQALS